MDVGVTGSGGYGCGVGRLRERLRGIKADGDRPFLLMPRGYWLWILERSISQSPAKFPSKEAPRGDLWHEQWGVVDSWGQGFKGVSPQPGAPR